MKWLLDVLREASGHINLAREADRELLAEAIIEAVPKPLVVEAIASAVSAVLQCRLIADGAGDLAREIARNSAHTVLVLLQADEGDPDNELAIPEAVSR